MPALEIPAPVIQSPPDGQPDTFRLLAEAIPQIVWTGEPDGGLDYYNQRWFDYTGLTLEQTRGWGWKPVIHPDDLQTCVDRWSRAVQTGELYEVEYRFRRADGVYRWHLGRALPVRDREGRIIKWFGTSTDIDDQKRAMESLRFLAEADRLLASSLDYEQTLSSLVQLVVPRIADLCTLDIVQGNDNIETIAMAYVDPARARVVRELRRQFPLESAATTGVAAVIRTGKAEILSELEDEALAAAARDPEHLRLLRELGPRSLMILPLVARGRTLGALTLVSTGEGRRFGASDLALAEELAGRASLAVDNARLYREAREALRRKEEEQRVAETLERLGRLLTSELDTAKVVQQLTDEATAITGAAFGAFFHHLIGESGEQYMLYTLSGVDRSHFEKFPTPRATAIFAPTFRGEAILRSDDIRTHPDYGKNPPHSGLPEGHLPVRSYLAVPVKSRSGKVYGGLFFGHPEPGRFKAEHERLVAGLAVHAAVALDNAELFNQVQVSGRERERALAQAELERARLQSIFTQAPAAIAVTRGPQHVFESANALYLRLVSREVAGRPVREVFPEVEGQGLFELLDQVYSSGKPYVGKELPVRFVHGGVPQDQIFDFIYQPLFDAGGAVDGIMILAIEVTQQVHARREVEQLAAEQRGARELLLRHAAQLALGSEVGALIAKIDNLPEMLQRCVDSIIRHMGVAFAGIWALRDEERVLDLEAHTGLSPPESYARMPVGHYKIGYVAQQRVPYLTNDLQSDKRVLSKEWVRRERLVAFAGYPLLVEDRLIGVLALFSREPLARDTLDGLVSVADVIAAGLDRKRSEAEQERLIQALERSNQELDQFAYVASHDLKAPLRGIANLSEWLEEDLGAKADDNTKEHLRLLRGRVHRMESLIDGILDYSRAGRARYKPERVDVRRLLTDVIELLAPPPLARVELAPDLPVLETQRIPLQQIFMNLVGNALKHARRDDPIIRVGAREAGRCYEFIVADNGQGIAPEFHERIWGIFQTLEARDKVEGTGIGLAVVKKIVESRGGRVWVESAVNAGAAFHFTWLKRETGAIDTCPKNN